MNGLGPKWTQGIPKRESDPRPDAERDRQPRRERTPFEAVSIIFGALIAAFGLWGAIDAIAGGDGPGSGAFIISVVFILLGTGRLLWGLRPPG